MKDNSNTKKRIFSIKYKFMILTAVLALFGIAAVTAVCAFLFSTSNKSNQTVISNLTGILSQEAYNDTLQTSSEFNGVIVSKQTKVTNQKLKSLRERSVLVSHMLSAEYKNEEFSIDAPKVYDEEFSITDKFFLAPGVTETDALLQEQAIIEPVLQGIMDYSNSYYAYSNAYLISKTGIFGLANQKKDYTGIDLRQEAPAYKIAMEKPGEFVWSDIYEDRVRGLCISGAITYNDCNGTPAGVFGIDVFIDELTSEIEEAKIGVNGKAFMLAKFDGSYQIIPSYILDSDVLEQKEWIDAFDTVAEGTNGQLEIDYDGRRCFLYYDTIKETNWHFCSIIDEREISKTSDTIKKELDETQNKITESANLIYKFFFYILIVMVIIIIVLVVIAAFIFASRVTKPILDLAKGTQLIGEGNLDVELSANSKDEIGELTVVINEMTKNLKDYINELTATTAEKEKVESEMEMAAQIQDGMIPDNPMDVDRVHVEGLMRPAKSVGGDFFDYFMVDDDHLAFIIADVSDKGVPAALFMAIGRTLLKEVTLTGSPLNEVFFRVNNILARNNENMQFITVFEGVIELSTGHVRYANAGHEKPFLLRSGEKFEIIEPVSSLPLGLMENMNYSEGSFEMKKGDVFFQYTDGVTDSVDSQGIMIEEAGVERMLNDMTDSMVIHEGKDDFVKGMLSKIDERANGADQFDDITMLLLAYDYVCEN